MVGGALTPPQPPTVTGRAGPLAMGKLSLAGSVLPTLTKGDGDGKDGDDHDWLPLRGAPGVAHAMVAAKLPVELLVVVGDCQPLTVDSVPRGV